MPFAHINRTEEELEIRKIFCVGRNYAEHVREMKDAIPEAPVFFLKPSTAIIGDGGIVSAPSISREFHHEVEMTVLIGKGGKNIQRGNALNHVAGYGIGLDMTMRDIQNNAKKKGLPWTLSKAFDTSAPISSFAPASDVPDPHNLGIRLDVNGTTRQHSNTRNLIFKVDGLIAFVSQFFTFERGDIIFTGTPEGVAPALPGDRLDAQLLSPEGNPISSLSVTVEQAPVGG